MIKTIKIDNFKSLNDVEINLTPFTILIGDNSVGKTTVLQAIAFLKYSCVSTFEKFLDERKLSVSDISSKFSAKKTISFSTFLRLDDKDIQWDIGILKGRDRLTLSYEKVMVNGEIVLLYTGNSTSYRFNAKTKAKEPVMVGSFSNSIIQFTDTAKQSELYPELVAIKNFFCNMETLDLLSPYNMKGSSQGESDVIGLSGEKLSSFIKKLSPAQRESLTSDIQKFMKYFSSIIPKTKQYGWVHLEAKESYNGRSIDVSSANISDGILRIIAFCSLRFLNNSDGSILLDEIEDGINNEHLELLVQALRKIQVEKNIQIIATTHNTVILDYWIDKKTAELDRAPNDGDQNASIIFLCRSNSGEVIAKNFLSSAEIRDKLSYMYPGEIVLNMTNSQLRDALQ